MFQTTATGSTYLQVFIIICLLIVGIYFFARQAIQIIGYAHENLTSTIIDEQELFRQINRHTPINGYRVFSEIQNGNSYTVTFLSRNNKSCVLAEVEDCTDPNGIIKIIAF